MLKGLLKEQDLQEGSGVNPDHPVNPGFLFILPSQQTSWCEKTG